MTTYGSPDLVRYVSLKLHPNSSNFIIAPAGGLAPAPGIAPAAPPLPPVSPGAVDAAIILADYLIARARAAYTAMGLDPAVSDVPILLAWLPRARLHTFTRRDARRALLHRIRPNADLDEAL